MLDYLLGAFYRPLILDRKLPFRNRVRGRAFENFALLGGRAFTNPRAIPELLHARGFLSEYNYTEGFTGKKADWLICQGQE